MAEFVRLVAAQPLWLLVLEIVLLVIVVALLVWYATRRRDPAAEAARARARRQRIRLPSGMYRACAAFHARLVSAFPGLRGRYRLPLFAVIGAAEGAGGGLVAGAGLPTPLGAPQVGGGLAWTGFDRGAVVEVDPALLDPIEASRWAEFLRLLERFRPQRPLDGVILTLPVSLLAGAAAPGEDGIRQAAERVRERIADLQNRLGMSLPVHVVLTGCEALTGFGELVATLPARRRESALGFAFPYGANEVYRPHWPGEAVDDIAWKVNEGLAEAMTAGALAGEADAALLLPRRIEELLPRLSLFLDTFFQAGSYARMASLRGLWLVGADTSAQRRGLRAEAADARRLNQPAGTADLAPQKVAFAAGMLAERIFPEATLAQPTHAGWITANRDVRRAQAAVAALAAAVLIALLLADSGLENRVSPLRSLVSAIDKDLRRVRTIRAGGGAEAALLQSDSIDFLRRLSAVEGAILRLALVPSSWLDRLPGDLERLQTGAYVEILFRSIHASLESRARAVTRPILSTRALAPAAPGSRANARPYPGIEPLAEQVSALALLQQQISNYAELRESLAERRRAPQALGSLVDYLYGLELPEGFFPTLRSGLIADEIAFAIEPLDQEDFVDAARIAVLNLHGELLRDLIARDDLSGRLRRVQRLLTAGSVVLGAEEQDLARLRTLRGELEGLHAILEGGRYDWVTRDLTAQALLDLGPLYEQTLLRIEDLPLLGPRVFGEMQQDGVEERARFAAALREIQVAGLGALVALDAEGVRLSQELRDVLARLSGFTPVAASQLLPGGVRIEVGGMLDAAVLPAPGADREIHWNIEQLRQTLVAVQRVDQRLAGRSNSVLVEDTLSRLVRQEKLDVITRGLAAAITVRPAGTVSDSFGMEGRLRQRVANFEAAATVLGEILFVLEPLAAPELQQQILALMVSDAEKLVGTADTLLDRGDLYSMSAGAVAAWDGEPGLAYAGFNAPGDAALLALLARQRGRVRSLAQEVAGPALRFLYANGLERQLGGAASLARWQAIIEDLDRYAADAPDSQLAQLEGYIAGRLTLVSTADCQLAQPGAPLQGVSFFAQKQQRLASAVTARCLDLKAGGVRERYAALAEQFNRGLAGRAPFAPADVIHLAPAVPVPELLAFIDRFDAEMNRGLGDPRYWVPRAPQEEGIPAFLDQLDQALDPLRLAVKDTDQGRTLEYELLVEFRVNRALEKDADQIIAWSLDSGGRERTLFNAAQPVIWRVGEPLELGLRWAANAPALPVAAPDRPGLNVNERSATLGYATPWALAALVARHDVTEPGEPAHLLQVSIPIQWQGGEAALLRGAEARLFLRLGLRAGGRTVALQPLPVAAPVLIGTPGPAARRAALPAFGAGTGAVDAALPLPVDPARPALRAYTR